jgi:cell division protein FtsX
MRTRAAALLGLIALVAGCGSATRQAAPARCVVRIYFCTETTCGHTATRGQITRVSNRLRRSGDVASVRFVSKAEALRIMRKIHPDAVATLPANPFPDALRVRPYDDVTPAKIAARVHAGSLGVHFVDFARDPACG